MASAQLSQQPQTKGAKGDLFEEPPVLDKQGYFALPQGPRLGDDN